MEYRENKGVNGHTSVEIQIREVNGRPLRLMPGHRSNEKRLK